MEVDLIKRILWCNRAVDFDCSIGMADSDKRLADKRLADKKLADKKLADKEATHKS